jgi:hypothetical protein
MEGPVMSTRLAQLVVAERTTRRREPVVLSYRGVLLRSLASQVQTIVDVLSRALNVGVNAQRDCMLSPEGC